MKGKEWCKTCRFYDVAGLGDAAESTGYCKRNAPTPWGFHDDDGMAGIYNPAWPVMADMDWCGEWEEEDLSDITKRRN